MQNLQPKREPIINNKETAEVQKKEREYQNEMKNFCKYLIPIVSSLLSGVGQLSGNLQQLDIGLHVLELIERILDLFYTYKIKTEDKLVKGIDEFNEFYIELSDAND